MSLQEEGTFEMERSDWQWAGEASGMSACTPIDGRRKHIQTELHRNKEAKPTAMIDRRARETVLRHPLEFCQLSPPLFSRRT